MRDETWAALTHNLEEFPILRGEPAEWSEIDEASRAVGLPFPDDYRRFIRRFGAGVVGAYPIFGVRPVEAMGIAWSVVERNRFYRAQSWPGVENWVVFSADHAGNPFGFAEGRVLLSDHDWGQIVEIAPNFEEFLIRTCKI